MTEPTAPSSPAFPGKPLVAGPTAVGFLPGNGSVDAAGVFNYDIPLDVPAGIAAMTPSLALHYSSGGGNGPLGRGWSVLGWTSAITLCNKTIASDGVTAGLAFDGTDPLCLDGAKLVPVANSSPTEYRTEQDSITRIVAAPVPAVFLVYLKNGRIRTYAPFTQTRLAGSGTAGTVTPRWMLTQEQDRAGNTINYVYDTEGSGAAQEILVDHIDYGTISGSSASRTIQFIYDTKHGTDANATAYDAGLENKLSQRLRQIQMLAPNPSTKQIVWSYQLGYEDQGLLGRTLLNSVQKVGSLGGSSVVRSFLWQGGYDILGTPETAAVNMGTHSTTSGDVWTWQVLDLNGDGKDDFVAQTTGGATHLGSSYAVYISTGSGFSTVGVTLPAGETFSLSESMVMDFSGNGQKGLLAKVYRSTARGSGTSCASVLTSNLTPPFYMQAASAPSINDGCYDYVPWTWNGSSFVAAGPALGTVPSDGGRLAASDMDGDGLLDVVSTIDSGGTRSAQWAAQLNQGNGSFGSPVTFPEVDTSCNLGATPASLTGDGRGQVMVGGPKVLIETTHDYTVCTNPVSGYPYGDGPCRSGLETRSYETNQMGCLNQSVALSLAPGNKPTVIALATGSSASYPESMFLADLNGDRLQDLVTLSSSTQSWSVQWNTGNGMGAPAPLTGVAPLTADGAYPVSASSAGPPFMVLDLDRDGRDDLLVNSSSTGGSAPWFTGLISNGDGSFTQQTNLTMGAGPASVPGTSKATTVPLGAGDFDGDGKLDLLLPQYNTSSGYIQYLQPILNNLSADVDLLIRASDAGVVRLGVQYGRTNPADTQFTNCSAFPQVCIRQGMPVVAWTFGADVGAAAYYRFENPRMDMHGRGFLGYDTVSEWEPFRPLERTTTFNNAFNMVETLGGMPHRIYPHAGRPATVTTVTGLVNHDSTWMNPTGGGADQSPPWSQPGSEPSGMSVRVTSSQINYATQVTPSGAAYLVTPNSATTNEWESSATVDWKASDPVHLSYTSPSPFTTWNGTYSYDGYGNLTSSNEYTTGGVHEIVNLQYYAPTTNNWLVSLLEQKQVMSWTDASGDGTAAPANYTTTQYAYDARGYPLTEVVEPLAPVGPGISAAPGATADTNVTTTYTIDAQGRLRSKVAQAGDTTQPHRSLYLDYVDVLGSGETVVYPSESWNEQGIGSYAWIQPAYGVAEATMDANGRTTTSVHDDLGRLVTTSTPDGDQIVTGYSITAASNLMVRTQASSGSAGYALLDMLGRTIETGTLGLGGQYSVVDRTYDVFGRVVSVTNPGFGAASPYATVSEYDSFNRPVAITGPDGSQTTFVQNYFWTQQTDPVGRYTFLIYDNDHRTQASEQYDATAAAWRTTSYTYAPFGHLNSVVDTNNNVTSMQYDLLGRRTQIVDPDSGTTATLYNGYGEVRETDTPTSSTTYTRDAAGRITWANNSVDGKTQYLYDLATDPAGNSYGADLGKLSATISPGGVRVDYYYDGLSRPMQQRYSSTAFTYQPTFTESYNDPFGRLTSVTYPFAPGRTPFQTFNTYTNGYLSEVDRNTPTGAVMPVRQITGTDPAGDLAAATYGNGDAETRSYSAVTLRLSGDQLTQPLSGATVSSMSYTYYADGRVNQRTDPVSGRNEVYTYDSLRRLSSWALTPPSASTTTTQYGYDTLGNLTQIQVNGSTTVQNVYGQYTTNGPHQLATTTVNGSPASYWYDASGREYVSSNLSITYRETSNLPSSITEQGLTTSFLYAADGERVEKSGPAGLTISAGHGLYERRVGQGTDGGDLHVFSIPGIAQVAYDDGAQTESTQYLHTDDVGTLHAVTGDSGAATFFYQEPFGKRTDVNGVPLAGYSGPMRGYFGGHEYDDDLGYVNMKGRLYDPNLRRFLTPDPFVANLMDGQTYNRYSYVANDPLNASDPSGFQTINKCHPPCTGNGGGDGTADDIYFSGPPPSPGLQPTQYILDQNGNPLSAGPFGQPTAPGASAAPGQVTGANSDAGTTSGLSVAGAYKLALLQVAQAAYPDADGMYLACDALGCTVRNGDGDVVGGLFDANTSAFADNIIDGDTKKLATAGATIAVVAAATKFLQAPAETVLDYIANAQAAGQAAADAAAAEAAASSGQAITQALVNPTTVNLPATTFAEVAWQAYESAVNAASSVTSFLVAPTYNLQHQGYAPGHFGQ